MLPRRDLDDVMNSRPMPGTPAQRSSSRSAEDKHHVHLPWGDLSLNAKVLPCRLVCMCHPHMHEKIRNPDPHTSKVAPVFLTKGT